MSLCRKKIYIANTSGMGNRLETLVLAGMIEDAHGHSIYLDWPEADCLTIAGTQIGAIPWWDRIGSLKLRDFDLQTLQELGGVRLIVEAEPLPTVEPATTNWL